jgi:hypothetical protein
MSGDPEQEYFADGLAQEAEAHAQLALRLSPRGYGIGTAHLAVIDRHFRILTATSAVGTFQTWRDVRLESVMRTKADSDYSGLRATVERPTEAHRRIVRIKRPRPSKSAPNPLQRSRRAVAGRPWGYTQVADGDSSITTGHSGPPVAWGGLIGPTLP